MSELIKAHPEQPYLVRFLWALLVALGYMLSGILLSFGAILESAVVFGMTSAWFSFQRTGKAIVRWAWFHITRRLRPQKIPT